MTTLTITHRAEQGTTLDGTARGDGTADILRTQCWRWSRTLGAWYIAGSRDRHPNTRQIETTAQALRTAGFIVDLDVVDDWRPTEQVEADKIARQADRAAALADRADRAEAAAEGAWAAHGQATSRLPEGGEPIHIGHHSEGPHRRALERAHTTARRALAADEHARTVQHRAKEAGATTGARYAPRTVHNRIEKLSADLRRLRRGIDRPVYDPQIGHVPASDDLKARRAEAVASRIAELEDQIAYWQRVRAEQGGYDRDDIHPGDHVLIRGEWLPVVRVNPKSITVPTVHGWTGTYPYAEITDHRPAA